MSLELGGKNAVIVLDDANLDEAVAAVAWAGFRHDGAALHGDQPGDRPSSGWRSFVERLAAAAEKLRVGDGLLAADGYGAAGERRAGACGA